MMPTFSERQELAVRFAADVARMRRCLQAAGKPIEDDDIVHAWADYSDAVCAGWLMLPETDDTLLTILLKHLPPTSKHWSATVVDSADGSGDGMLPLPADLLAQTGWKDGDKLRVVMDERGSLILQRVE